MSGFYQGVKTSLTQTWTAVQSFPGIQRTAQASLPTFVTNAGSTGSFDAKSTDMAGTATIVAGTNQTVGYIQFATAKTETDYVVQLTCYATGGQIFTPCSETKTTSSFGIVISGAVNGDTYIVDYLVVT